MPHSFRGFTESFPLFSSPAGREEVGRCFNFTSRALDHYQVLNLSRDVLQDQIRPSYMTLARVCHPDKLMKEAVGWEAANANFERLRLAYDILADELSRCRYECDVLFDIFSRTMREWRRCGDCSRLKYWRFGAAEEEKRTGSKKKMKQGTDGRYTGGMKEQKPRPSMG